MSERRGFLKLAAALGLVHYAQPLLATKPLHDWVDDRGDFYVVKVPEGKSMSHEVFSKPTIFQLGNGAVLSGLTVHGFCNMYGRGQILIKDSVFDASKCSVDEDRSVVFLDGSCGLTGSFDGITVIGNGRSRSGVHYRHSLQA